MSALRHFLAAAPAPDPRVLAGFVATKHIEKHHVWLSDALLEADYAAGRLDVEGGLGAVGAVTSEAGSVTTARGSDDGIR